LKALKEWIVKRWSDSFGKVFYNVVFEDPGSKTFAKSFRLIKVSNSGTVFEQVIGLRGFPTKIDPKHRLYYIYYRRVQMAEVQSLEGRKYKNQKAKISAA